MILGGWFLLKYGRPLGVLPGQLAPPVVSYSREFAADAVGGRGDARQDHPPSPSSCIFLVSCSVFPGFLFIEGLLAPSAAFHFARRFST